MRTPATGYRPDPARAAARKAARRILGRSVLVAGILITAYYLLPMDRGFTTGTIVALVAGLVGSGTAFAWQLKAIASSPNPRLTAIAALVSTIPLFLLLFATSYYLIGHANPASFTERINRTDSLYFTVTVFSTVGFGDIAPRSEPARLLATGQMMLDLLLIGVAARLLVNALTEATGRQHKKTPAGTPQNDGDQPPAGR